MRGFRHLRSWLRKTGPESKTFRTSHFRLVYLRWDYLTNSNGFGIQLEYPLEPGIHIRTWTPLGGVFLAVDPKGLYE